MIISIMSLISCRTTEKGSKDFIEPQFIQQMFDEKAKIDQRYKEYSSLLKPGPVIPGLFQGAVPQGLAYFQENEWLLISSYMFDERPANLAIVSMEDKKHIKTLWLFNSDKTPHKGHVGGLAVSGKHLWIASGSGVYSIPLRRLSLLKHNSIMPMEEFTTTNVKASFASYSDGVLWIGEFTSRDGTYSSPLSHHYQTTEGFINHGWICGYKLDEHTDLIRPEKIIENTAYPDLILSIPDEVQGMAFSGDKIILSKSYGRNNDSRIVIHKNPLTYRAHDTIQSGGDVPIPLWILGSENLIREIPAPPMTEGICLYGDFIAVLYESGSDKYRRTSRDQQDSIHFLRLSDSE